MDEHSSITTGLNERGGDGKDEVVPLVLMANWWQKRSFMYSDKALELRKVD